VIHFWATVCKTVHLSYRTIVCLSALSVTLMYCGQTAGWIKMLLGMEVGLGPGDCVRWGPTSPLQNGAEPPIFSPCLLWLNGWMDQDGTWHEGRLGSGHVVLDGDPAPPPQKGDRAPNFRPVPVAKWLDRSRWHVAWRWTLVQSTLF